MLRYVLAMATVMTSSYAAMPSMPMEFPGRPEAYPDKLEIHNRVLIKINGSPISVMDVVRKMDLFFFQQYPQLVDQPMFRYQMYRENWRAFLQRAIDDQLMLADAKEKKIEVTEGEVREELERTLGPHVVFNVEALGLHFDEAWELVKTELLVQKVKGAMVHARAWSEVHPRNIKERYEKKMSENPSESRWVYQVISLKGEEEYQAADAAHKVHDLLVNQRVPLEMIQDQLPAVAVNISAAYSRSAQEISQAHRSVLEGLSNGGFSEPVVKRGIAYIFYLQEFQKATPPSLASLSADLKRELIQELIIRYDQEYRERLRKRYGLTAQFVSQLVPDETQPFAIR